jgi:hypothetical protein
MNLIKIEKPIIDESRLKVCPYALKLYIHNVTPETKIEIPDYIKDLHIHGDYLEHFDIPDGLISVNVNSLGLKSLYVPDSVKYLYCAQNFLRKLEVPIGIMCIDAHNNLLTEITFREPKEKNINTLYLDIHSNRFTILDFDVPLDYLNASLNKIEYINTKIYDFLIKQKLESRGSNVYFPTHRRIVHFLDGPFTKYRLKYYVWFSEVDNPGMQKEVSSISYYFKK